MGLRTRTNVQSPRAYDLANLTLRGLPVGTDSGAVNAYVVTLPASAAFARGNGRAFVFTAANTNTGAATVNVAGLGAVALVDSQGNALRGGEISSLGPNIIVDNGINYQVVGGVGATPDKARTAAETAAAVVPSDYSRLPLDVKRYGAKGDGVTDDRAAIKTAWTVAVQAGGGRITFPDAATYFVSSLDPLSPLVFPNQNSNGSIGTQSYQCAFVFRAGNNVEFDFNGSTIQTNITGGGNFFVFDHCTNIKITKGKFVGAQVMSTGAVAGNISAAGAGYTPGTYRKVPMTGGTGNGAVFDTIVVGAGGTVTVVTPSSSDPTQNYPGGNYAVNDVLSCAAANIGGTGAGFTFTLTSITGAGPTVLTASQNCIVCCALTGSTSEIETTDLTVTTMYSAVWAVADPVGSPQNTVSHLHIRGLTTFRNGFYAIAFHNAGDNSTVDNLYAYRDDRGLFFYGVQNVVVGNVVVDQLNYGFQSLIKAYNRNTQGITIHSYNAINQPGQSAVVGRIAIQVQCDPAVVNPPPTVQNVFIEYNERNITAGQSFEFDYFAGVGGTTLTATSANKLFDNLCIKGSTAGNLFTNVNLNAAGSVCLCDFDQFKYFQPALANSVDNANGFVKAVQFGYTPALTFGGAAVGLTTSVTNGRYYIRNGMLYFHLQITLTAVGSSVGNAQVTVPLPPRSDEVIQHLSLGSMNPAVGLGGNVIGILPTSGSTLVTLETQAAAALNAITNANFAATTTLLLSGNYPV